MLLFDQNTGRLRKMRVSCHPPNESVGIKQAAQRRLLPTFKFFRRQGFKKLGPDLDLPFPSAGLAIAELVFDGYQLHDRLFPWRYNDLLALAGFLISRESCVFAFRMVTVSMESILAALTG